ncbi:MAG: hypothetical protein AB8G18_17355 [Gammaproteobacteria bacterium]
MDILLNAIRSGRGLLWLAVICITAPSIAQDHREGQLRKSEEFEAWSQNLDRWVTPLEFWHDFASTNGGLTWGSRDSYPPYSKVKERDFMIINVASGPCLMEFFHTRWRRANDVRRWDTQFNEVGGCPNVFD